MAGRYGVEHRVQVLLEGTPVTGAINDQLGAAEPEDDVAVLAVRRVPQPITAS